MRKTEVQLVDFFPEKNDMNDIFFSNETLTEKAHMPDTGGQAVRTSMSCLFAYFPIFQNLSTE